MGSAVEAHRAARWSGRRALLRRTLGRGAPQAARPHRPGHALKQKATKALKTQLTLLATLENARASNRHTRVYGAYSKINLNLVDF